MGVIEIHTTVGDLESAESLAVELVTRRVAACVQVDSSVTSTYRWGGRIETASELRLTIKSTDRCLASTIETIRKLHPYTLPEIVWSEIEASPEYEAWVNGCLEESERG